MGAFESVGNMLEQGISGYSEQISAALIANISPVIFTGVSLYFLLKGWMFLTGRAEGAVADTVISAFKIALISMVGLNTGNFVSWAIGFINGAEELLSSSLPHGAATNTWRALDNMWQTIGQGVEAYFKILASLSWRDFGYALLLDLMIIIFFIAGVFLTLAALGVLIVTKLSLVVIVGFGPLFICLLMFPVTKSWFDGWLRSCMNFIFTMVMMAAVISLVTDVFADRMDVISKLVNDEVDVAEGGFANLMIGSFTFLIVCIGLATLVKAIPGMASGIAGGVGMGSVGLGRMVAGIGSNTVKMGAAGLATSAMAVGNSALASGAMNVVAGRTTQSMLLTGASGAATGYTGAAIASELLSNAASSRRAQRSLNAAHNANNSN